MAVTVTIRARLKGDPESMRKLHDQVTGATKDMAKQAGDLTHVVYLSPQDPRDFFGVDTWQSAEQVMAFSSNPQIQDFFSQLFEGQPEVKIWTESGWNRW